MARCLIKRGYEVHVLLVNGFRRMYSRITSTKSPSFGMTTCKAMVTMYTVLLLQSRDSSCHVSRPILAVHSSDYRNTLVHAHTVSRILPRCDISLDPIILPAHEAGAFLKSVLLYQRHKWWELSEVTGRWMMAEGQVAVKMTSLRD